MKDYREEFEEKVFAHHFLSTIEHTGLGQCMEFLPDPAKVVHKSELCDRDGLSYKREDVSAMWFGWQLAIKFMTKEATS